MNPINQPIIIYLNIKRLASRETPTQIVPRMP